ncbi:MAG: hypothetical protein V4683_13295 [Bacteroidota bacterium]
MNTIEIKKQINEKLAHLEDENLLNVINELLNSKISNKYFIMTDFEKRRAESARKQFEEKTLIPNHIVKEKAQKWLNSK